MPRVAIIGSFAFLIAGYSSVGTRIGGSRPGPPPSKFRRADRPQARSMGTKYSCKRQRKIEEFVVEQLLNIGAGRARPPADNHQQQIPVGRYYRHIFSFLSVARG